jgi:large subunit ribosomal protein L13Ae
MVVPEALKVLRIKSHRKTCQLGELAAQIGWKRQTVVAELEAKRKAKSQKYHEAKQKKLEAKAKLASNPTVKAVSAELQKFGF